MSSGQVKIILLLPLCKEQGDGYGQYQLNHVI